MYACMLSSFSHVRLFVTLWTVAHQAPLSMGYSRQEYWSGKKKKNTGVGCHVLLQGIFPTQGSNLGLFLSPALAGRFFSPSTFKALRNADFGNFPWVQWLRLCTSIAGVQIQSHIGMNS